MRWIGSKTMITFAAVLHIATSAYATPTMDQQNNLSGSNSGWGIDGQESLAQTFTVGLGGLFAGVSLQIYSDEGVGGSLSININTTASGRPTDITLASASVENSSLPTVYDASIPFTFIDLSNAGLLVAAGDVLAIVVNGSSSMDSAWGITYSDGYAGGEGLENVYGAGWRAVNTIPGDSSVSQFDFNFATYVDARPESSSSAPEPASIALLGSGLVLVGAALKRRFGFCRCPSL